MIDLSEGIAVDAAHSTKNNVTEMQGVDLATGEIIFYQDLGNQTINIGEFLAIVEGIKHIIANGKPKKLYSDSMTAICWARNKQTASGKRNRLLQIAEVYLKSCAYWVDQVEIIHWNNKDWGEIPADFNRK